MMQPIQFSETGIQTLLQNLNTNKSPDPDGIHPIILKHCASKLAPILKVIFTQPLNTGNIPADWLVDNVTPVYKKGAKDLATNYCLILLTTICSKVMHFIMSHLNQNDVLQNSFRAGYSQSHS